MSPILLPIHSGAGRDVGSGLPLSFASFSSITRKKITIIISWSFFSPDLSTILPIFIRVTLIIKYCTILS